MKIAWMIILIGLSLMACKKEGCTDSGAENFSSKADKDDGSCTFARDKFLGTWQINQQCQFEASSTYSMTIQEGGNSNQIVLSKVKLSGFEVDLQATVNGGNFTFEQEKLGIIFKGNGYISGAALTIDYTACEAIFYPCSEPESCTLTGTK